MRYTTEKLKFALQLPPSFLAHVDYKPTYTGQDVGWLGIFVAFGAWDLVQFEGV